MKHSFRSLTGLVLSGGLAALALYAMETNGQGVATIPRLPASSPRPAAPAAVSGQQLVAQATRCISSEPAVSAELRYRIDAFGHELAGTGSYVQFGAGPEKLLRLDLRMQVGDRVATVQEIRGEDTYWIRRDVPPAPPSLSRVDLKALRKALAPSAAESSGEVLPQGDWIMLGGLTRLLAALDRNFTFEEPKPDELQFTAADGKSQVRLPIWTVAGTWKAEKIAYLLGREPGKPGILPEQFPDRVELVLGRTDDVLPLFPYRITYWRTTAMDAKRSKDTAIPPRELLTLELFNVSRKHIDQREFQYHPGDQDVHDVTPAYVQRLSSERKLR